MIVAKGEDSSGRRLPDRPQESEAICGNQQRCTTEQIEIIESILLMKIGSFSIFHNHRNSSNTYQTHTY
ncbi:hypothetical protein [Sutcliffiella horikoshii]|uniref:Uncharacterized protein n=1 Tax=Sutcliffiella horikoshii TaxID=79883 RepID=A0A5D4TAN6_9BACI|nr:hypothetical protein [Sutcliffiella horikoshii]TYS72265.1 hypothetical protein FZC75_09895 [Sutcliffiella horikoshii]